MQQPSKRQKVDVSGMTNVIVQFQSDDGTSTGRPCRKTSSGKSLADPFEGARVLASLGVEGGVWLQF